MATWTTEWATVVAVSAVPTGVAIGRLAVTAVVEAGAAADWRVAAATTKGGGGGYSDGHLSDGTC